MKRCGRCGESKPCADFYRDKRAPDGLQARCKECARAVCRRWREANMTPERHSWRAMLTRCRNPNQPSWKWYGALGTTVCDRWDPSKGGSFANFLADMGERAEGMTLDRIDPDGHYEPENCRWATWSEQRRNHRQPSTA